MLYCIYPRSLVASRWVKFSGAISVFFILPFNLQAVERPEVEVANNNSAPTSLTFDMEVLKSRGIDTSLAEYFSKAPRFSGGANRVALFVNGIPRGDVNVLFDAEGALRFDSNLLDAANLVLPPATTPTATRPPSADYDFVAAYPNTVIDLRPGKTEVHLVVPPEAIRPFQRTTGHFTSGGHAALLNYRALATQSEFAGGSSSYNSLDTEAGFNSGDWIVRSRQNYTVQNGKQTLNHLYAYGQKSFPALEAMVQGGQINVANNLVSGDAITGIQLLPEDGLRSTMEDSGVVVEGIAHSTARVEVRQNNAVIHTTVVPAGAFRLTGVPLLSGNSDLHVTVIEADNSQQSFVIPAASFAGAVQGPAPGYSLAAGQYRTYGKDKAAQPMLLAGSGTWRVAKSTNVTAGLLGATGYQTAGWGVDQALTANTGLGIRQQVSNAREEGVQGTQISASLSSSLTRQVSARFSATRQTEHYRYLDDIAYRNMARNNQHRGARTREQYTSSLGWTNKHLGAVHLAHSYSARFDNQSTQRLVGGWSQSYKHASVSLSLEKSLGPTDRYDRGTSTNLSISMPFGGRSIRSVVNHDQTRTRTGVSLSERVNDEFGYQLQTERDSASRQTDLSVMTQLLPHYTQASLGYSRYGSGSTSYNASLNGGMVAHANGLTFSPYPVGDTFSLLKVGELSGVKVATPQGPVWTDFTGRAVAPGLTAYSNNRLTIDTKSLPRNADINNALKELEVGRGSVSRVDFQVSSSRRLLITAKDANGKPLDKGLSVLDEAQRYITTSVGNGQIFILNAEPGTRLSVSLSDKQSCVLDYALSDTADMSAYFESVDAVCRTI